ncbi:MAG: phosphocholine cytidylyltransferase family protein [Candidatus Thorarchaeota archaeon]
MKAIILAAGRSRRIRSLTKDKPKCLLNINDSTILGHQLTAISSCDIGQATVVIGYMKEKVEEYLDEVRRDFDLNIETISNEQYETTDNAYSLSLALNEANHDSIIVLDGDILFDVILLKDLLATRSGNSLLVDNSRKPVKEDCKVVVRNGHAIAIGKGKDSNFVYTSMIKLGGRFLEEFKSELNKNREKMEWYSEPLDRVLRKHPRTMKVQFTNGRSRCEIDTEADFNEAIGMYNMINGDNQNAF